MCGGSGLNRWIVLLGPLAVSWVAVASLPLALTSVPNWNPHGGWPEVPYLLKPGGAGEHVRSSVYYFVIVALGGGVAAAVIEWSKAALARSADSSLPYVVLVLHQIVTWADAIRTAAYDWWTYLLHVMQVYAIDSASWQNLHPSLIGRWPWPSAISALVAAVTILAVCRDGRSRGRCATCFPYRRSSP
jgi:hypothetical protein